MKAKSEVPEQKKKEVEELTGFVERYPVIAISDMHGLPARQFQEIREKLRGKAVIRVAKLTLLRIAIDKSSKKEALKKLEDYFDGIPVAIIFTEMNPFALMKLMKKSVSEAPAKPGQIAPYDIVVPAGDTGLPPGPSLGDFKQAGIDARIDGSTIKVMSDSVVAEEGEPITDNVAIALNKLGVKPMRIEMGLLAALEGSQLFAGDILDISEEEIIQKLQQAHSNAYNLAFNSGYFTSETIMPMLQECYFNALNLGINALIFDTGYMGDVLADANARAVALKSHVREVPEKPVEEEKEPEEETNSEEPKKAKPEKNPAEETKEEVPEEEERPKAEEEPKREEPAEEPEAEEAPGEEVPEEKPAEKKPVEKPVEEGENPAEDRAPEAEENG
jgi:large subunit ribosomal protein L10